MGRTLLALVVMSGCVTDRGPALRAAIRANDEPVISELHRGQPAPTRPEPERHVPGVNPLHVAGIPVGAVLIVATVVLEALIWAPCLPRNCNVNFAQDGYLWGLAFAGSVLGALPALAGVQLIGLSIWGIAHDLRPLEPEPPPEPVAMRPRLMVPVLRFAF
jgi:hypothetical protein